VVTSGQLREKISCLGNSLADAAIGKASDDSIQSRREQPLRATALVPMWLLPVPQLTSPDAIEDTLTIDALLEGLRCKRFHSEMKLAAESKSGHIRWTVVRCDHVWGGVEIAT
jgi:hypothetical protein